MNLIQENNKNISPYAIPKEVWHLVHNLCFHGIKSPNSFEIPGLSTEFSAIREGLDCGSQDSMRILQFNFESLFLINTVENVIGCHPTNR